MGILLQTLILFALFVVTSPNTPSTAECENGEDCLDIPTKLKLANFLYIVLPLLITISLLCFICSATCYIWYKFDCSNRFVQSVWTRINPKCSNGDTLHRAGISPPSYVETLKYQDEFFTSPPVIEMH